jgi:hypothetical protein
MTKFVCSYAYDIACYADFVVEAKTEKAALRQIRKALREERFENVSADPCWENGPDNERVFVQGPATEFSPTTTLDELTGREHRFSLHTGQCVRCGRDAADDAVENTPCVG